MTGRFRGADGIEKLLKIAKAEAEAVRVDVVDIDRAKAAAAEALTKIAESVSQEVGAKGDPMAFVAYAEAMRERRFNLRKTLSALEAARDAAQEKLSVAAGEIAKLERLVEINARDGLLTKRRREARAETETATPHKAAS